MAVEISYFTADITLPAKLEDLPTDFDILYFIVSPDGRNEDSYREIYESGLNNLLNKFSLAGSNPHWIFVSSTSVYGQSRGEWVDEKSIAEPKYATSQLIGQAAKTDGSGPRKYRRTLFRHLWPRSRVTVKNGRASTAIQQNPPYFTNRIHVQDCIGILAFTEVRLAGAALEQCYLASDDDPAPLWDVMSWLAEHMNCQPPTVKSADIQCVMNKRCNNQRLKALGYKFLYPGFKNGYIS